MSTNSASSLVPLTLQQINQLKAYEGAGQYGDAYKYLRDIENPTNGSAVGVPNSGTLSSWLDKAASINTNDGSFVSNAVRGATKGYGEYNGSPISDQKFQDASNRLAKDVFKDVYDRGGIPPLNDIIKKDVQTAVEQLGLKRLNQQIKSLSLRLKSFFS